MKKVIFVCLLSLAVCLGKPASEQAAPTVLPTNVVNATVVGAKDQIPEKATANVTETQVPAKVPPATEQKTTTQNATETQAPSSVPPVDTNTTKIIEDNKTNDKDVPKDNKEKEASPKVTEKPTIDTKPNEKAKNETTTVAPTHPAEIPKTTEAPKSNTDKPALQARGFDGASFIGGIVLTLGLLAIGFMGFKYYKNQTENNYHTL